MIKDLEASMSTLIHPRHRGYDQPPAPSRTQSKARALGFTSAAGLVVGSIVGTGARHEFGDFAGYLTGWC